MALKMSEAFAAFRTSVIAELNHLILNENVPAFNAEAEDIRRQHEQMSKDLSIGEALADFRKRARINDLIIRRNAFIESLQNQLKETMLKRVDEYGGEIKEEEDKGKKILVAHFKDGSKARMPKAMWIQYNLYERV